MENETFYRRFAAIKLNVIWPSSVDRKNILLPPLLIKLGLVKQFVKASSTEGPVSQDFMSMFPKLSKAKVEPVVGELFRNVVQGLLL